MKPITVHLIDGTYELFRHFYGLRRFNKGNDKPYGAVTGVLNSVLQMIEDGATHIGVATDHVIESFRNDLWPGYKTGEGIETALSAQFHPLEEAIESMGITLWPMIELEADDALASAAFLASSDPSVEKVIIWSPDKDLAQCVVDNKVVQMDRRAGEIRDAEAVSKKYGVKPALIPDLLALAGDSADGYPGIPGIGKVNAARLLNTHGRIENFPENILNGHADLAFLFKKLATLRTDANLFTHVDQLIWKGPYDSFAAITEKINEPRLLQRAGRLSEMISD